MDKGRWLELGLLTDTPEIEDHPRLLRSLSFGDDDYDSCVYSVVPTILADRAAAFRLRINRPQHSTEGEFANLQTVSDFLSLPEWLAESDPKTFDALFCSDEAALPDGTLLSAVEAAAARLEVGEMRRQIERIRRDHADDPEALLGQAKELLETTCKTILGLTGDDDDQDDVPGLIKRTQIHLGLDPQQVGDAGGDAVAAKSLKRLLGGVGSVLNGAAELRNRRGTGHGRSGGRLVDGAVARLAVGLVLAAVVYFLEVYEEQTEPEEDPVTRIGRMALGNPSDPLSIGATVEHSAHGEGRVTDLQGFGSRETATVDFGGSQKRLLTAYAGLKVVQEG